ncbi:response regulator transcription factor [Candidatus Saccharibacteria bacterium]|nr:response regulator transcription factor [Candidatus Saccharibacteria bacterium]
MKILVVEDEHRIAQAIKEGLEVEGYAVDVEHDGQAGYDTAVAGQSEYDLLLLDVMMPGLNGNEVARKLRSDGIHTPILMLTAKNQEQDIVKGLDTGADDYLAKPFSFDVLLARIRALLRRPSYTFGETLIVGDLTLDPAEKRVERAGQLIRLTSKEFAILEYFMRNPDRVLSKDAIISHVWDFDADVLPNNVEVFITFIRTKIDKPFKKPLLHTVRGFGYKLSINA